MSWMERSTSPALVLFFCFYPYPETEDAVVLWCGKCGSYLCLGGQLAALYGLAALYVWWFFASLFVPEGEMVRFVCRVSAIALGTTLWAGLPQTHGLSGCPWFSRFPPRRSMIGVLLTYIGIRLATGIPLIDGIYSERYQESQLQPDSYVYFIWIRFVVLLLTLLVAAFAMKFLPRGKRSVGVVVTGSLLVVLFCFSAFCLPGPYEVRNNRMNELSVWEQRNDWDTIIREHPEKEETDYSWDRTYYMSCLLSDIHYMIGDISLSEGYAMEGLTLAKRGGSPRLLQRLVKISLIRRDFALADKYLGILGRLPGYRRWAEKYAGYIRHPERIGRDGELAAKTIPVFQPDNLLCLTGIDNLWVGHLSEPGVNRVAWEYLGCSYLLAKEMEKFKIFLSHAGRFLPGQSLPVHFQEAALVLATEDLSVLDWVSIRPEIVQRYKQFQKDILKIKNSSDGLSWLYRQYGDTFWFYYYCKNLNG